MSHVSDGELTAYADGAYSPADADAKRIAAHLALCPNCRNRLEQAHALGMRAAEILATAAPIEFNAPPFEQIRAHAQTRRARSSFPLTWAATVILALGIGWFGRGALRDPRLEEAFMRATPGAEMHADAVAPAVAPSAAAPETEEATQNAVTQDGAAAKRAAPQLGADPAPRDEAAVEMSTLSARPQDAPAPTALVGNAEAKVTADGGAAARTAIEYMTAAEAERRGIALLAVPELEIQRVGVFEEGVQVEQKLPDGKLITISAVPWLQPRLLGEAVESSAEAAAQRQAQPPAARREAFVRRKALVTPEAVDTVVVVRAKVLITISGALSADSLRKIGGQIR